MAEKTFKLEVVTPDRVVLSDDTITSVVVPGTEGYLGVLANHAPLMTELKVGEVDFKRADGSSDAMAVSGGFMEVLDNTVTVLAETAELASEIDIERAEKSAERARERISDGTEVDTDRAQIALSRALNRIRVAHRG